MTVQNMTLQYKCPSFSVHEHVIDGQDTTDTIRYVLLVYDYGGYQFFKFDPTGRLVKTCAGIDISKFDLNVYL